jgi:hypothetical protein
LTLNPKCREVKRMSLTWGNNFDTPHHNALLFKKFYDNLDPDPVFGYKYCLIYVNVIHFHGWGIHRSMQNDTLSARDKKMLRKI